MIGNVYVGTSNDSDSTDSECGDYVGTSNDSDSTGAGCIKLLITF